MILKNLNAPYEQGVRTRAQWKLKGFSDVDAFVTGFVASSDDKSLKDYIGGLKFSAYVDGTLREIAAVSNIDLATRKDATVLVDGKPELNPDFMYRCAALIGQDWNEKSLRLNSARINEWRDDKTPEECQVRKEDMKFNTSI